MQKSTGRKHNRILEIYTDLQRGAVLNKNELAQQYNVTPRSIQRDIDDLRAFLADQRAEQQVVYHKRKGGYVLVDQSVSKFSSEEALAAVKILLESRALTKSELFPILEKLLVNCVPRSQASAIRSLIANEQLYYIEPTHGRPILSTLWTLGEAVQAQQRVRIVYQRLSDGETVSQRVAPVGIMFSEYRFYLLTYPAGTEARSPKEQYAEWCPSVYRVDRILELEPLREHFSVPYRSRFQEGEFRRRMQSMFGGMRQTLRFRYSGPSIQDVLNRLPMAEVLSQDENGWEISVEVTGPDIHMCLSSQGEFVEVLN